MKQMVSHVEKLGISIILCIAFLHGFVSTAQASEAEQIDPINAISNLYSNTELELKLAVKPGLSTCDNDACIAQNHEFDARVLALGKALQQAALENNPGIKKRIPHFEFIVANKKDFGTTSNAAGKVVVFRGLQQLELSDEALSFLIAREMGHVIGRHHDKNIATKLIISAIASVVFPAVAIVSASSTAQQASTATTLVTSAASTATSMVGSEVAMHKMKPNQIAEADDIAFKMMEKSDWDIVHVANMYRDDLEVIDPKMKNTWTDDLSKTAAYLDKKAAKLAEAIPTSLPTEGKLVSAF